MTTSLFSFIGALNLRLTDDSAPMIALGADSAFAQVNVSEGGDILDLTFFIDGREFEIIVMTPLVIGQEAIVYARANHLGFIAKELIGYDTPEAMAEEAISAMTRMVNIIKAM